MRNINRTIYLSKCEGSRFNYATNEFEDFNCEMEDKLSEKTATIRARKMFGDNTIVIYHVEHEKHYYTISAEDFIKHAERIY